ncbi:FKBP-type peptidyl-prolyl cis-trans isomerase, partial [Saprospiraceae bacterium]|nr:FKBP-type peptidyl-prolyl cis-trans isomerase [Saprospiraceae bacterium]
LTTNNLLASAQVTASGIYYIIEEPGNTVRPGLNDVVKCNYKGYYPNEDVFDSNQNSSFTLGATIEGWRQGIPLIGEGGSVRLFIPSVLAYGKAGRGDIPRNQELFFDVDLIKVN